MPYGGGLFIMTRQDTNFFIDDLLVRMHSVIEMIWWTGLAPWELEFSFPGSRISIFLAHAEMLDCKW